MINDPLLNSVKASHETIKSSIEEIKNVLKKTDKFPLHVDSEFIEPFRAYASIRHDLEFVKEVVVKMLEIRIEEDKKEPEENDDLIFASDLNQTLKRSYFIAAITTYARCFNSSDNRRVRLIKEKCFKNLPEISKEFNLEKTHQQIMSLRNQYIAHAGTNDAESYDSLVRFRFVNEKEIELCLENEIIAQYGFTNNELKSFLALSSYLSRIAKDKSDELGQKFFKQITPARLKELIEKEAVERIKNFGLKMSL